MPNFEPKNPDFTQRVADSYELQTIMATIGAELGSVEAGEVRITLPYRADLCQQHGFLHAGIVTTILDSAAGYAAFSLMPADAEVLSIEFKTNLLAPAKGQLFHADGVVVKPGRTVTVAESRLTAIDDGQEKLVATMSCTLMAVYHHSSGA